MECKLIIFWVFFGFTVADIFLPDQQTIFAVPLVWDSQSIFPEAVSGRLVGINSSDIHGNILISTKLTSTLDWNLFFLQSKLPRAVILVPDDPFPGADQYLMDCWECANAIEVPFVSVSNNLFCIDIDP